jgi:hemoglobin/transferrin/lactoferrin receptor protein
VLFRQKKPLWLALALPAAAWAQQAPADTPAATALPEITNTATRTERRVDAVPATVTVKPAAEVENRGARDLKDLFRHEVDLAVRAAAPRFTAAGSSTGRAGNEGLNVRGLEGNQVLVLVDGIRMPQAFSFGAFASGRLDTLAVEGASTVEVLRGPASTQFGSDGLAGAVALRTLEPTDLLKPGQTFGGFLRAFGSTVDESVGATGAAAWRQGALQTLMLASRREGHESDTQGRDASPDARRTAPNPLAYSHTSTLGKLRMAVAPQQQLGLTLEAVRRSVSSDVVSARSAPATPLPATAVLGLAAQDVQNRGRASLEWKLDDLDAAFIQQAEAKLYSQLSRVRQRAFEDRNTAADRTRDGQYRESISGLSALASASLVAPVPQRLSAGIDASSSDIRAVRDGTVPPFGESFPNKPFPDTTYRLLGAFAQSELELGRFTLIPALRLDRYTLDPSQAGYTGGTVVKLSDQAATPRLGVVWRLSETLRPYAQWSQGFRAPTPEQVNNGFTNVASGYRSIGNPTLQPERARSVEIGLRGRVGTLSWQLAAYDNRYRDFISQQQIGGSFTPTDPAVFQYINLDQARIRGGELRLRWAPAAGWQLHAAAAMAEGDSTRNGLEEPLITVEPAKLGLGLRHERGAWQWRADVQHVRAKAADRIPAAQPPTFAPPAYTVLDLGATVKLLQRLTLHLNLDNALDETYWRWSDVRGVSASSAVLDHFTAPGRHVSLTARLDF